MFKIAFVGVGSIATRHLKNVYSYMTERGEDFEIDVFRSGLGRPLSSELDGLVSRQFVYGEKIDCIYDVVFITNPTSLHFDALEKFQDNGRAFFIEKPVFDSLNPDLSKLMGLRDKVCYVACPLRYNPVLTYVKDNINVDEVISVRAMSSSYLPDWRPGTDYRTCYSAHTDMGGGVDIDLIHEWDYLTFLFGDVIEGYSIAKKISNLEIDSNDIAIYIAKTEKTAIELHLDYFGRKTLRNLTIFTKYDTIDCDIIEGKIKYLNENKELFLENDRNAFQLEEIKHFFDIAFGNIDNDSTLLHGLKVLQYAKGEF